jgi:hypothetical protein
VCHTSKAVHNARQHGILPGQGDTTGNGGDEDEEMQAPPVPPFHAEHAGQAGPGQVDIEESDSERRVVGEEGEGVVTLEQTAAERACDGCRCSARPPIESHPARPPRPFFRLHAHSDSTIW